MQRVLSMFLCLGFCLLISLGLPNLKAFFHFSQITHNIVLAEYDTGAGGVDEESPDSGDGTPSSNNDNETVGDTGENTAAGQDDEGNPAEPDPGKPTFPPPGTTPNYPGATPIPTPPPGTPAGTADTLPGVSSSCNGTNPVVNIDWVQNGSVTPAYYEIRRHRDIIDSNPDGLQGYYFNGTNLGGSNNSWTDAKVDFSTQSPAYPYYFGKVDSNGQTISHENFSVQWRGEMRPTETGSYTFNINADDGIRFWIGRAKIIDSWVNTAPFTRSETVRLVAGQKYSITLDYFNGTGPGEVHLSWVTPSGQTVTPNQTTSKLYAGKDTSPAEVVGTTTNTYYSDPDNNTGGFPSPTSNTLYAYRVVAVGTDGSRKASNAFSVRTPNCTMPNITNVSCGPGNQPSALVNFNSSAINVNTYNIYRNDGTSAPLIASVHDTSFTDNSSYGMQSNTNYQYQVQAFTVAGSASPVYTSGPWFNSNSCDTVPPTAYFDTNIAAGGCYDPSKWNDSTFQPLKAFATDNSGIQSVSIKLKNSSNVDVASVGTQNIVSTPTSTVTVNANDMAGSFGGSPIEDGKWYKNTGSNYLQSYANNEDTGNATATFGNLVAGQTYTVAIKAGAGAGTGALIDITSPTTTNTIYRAGNTNFEETLSGLTFTANSSGQATIVVRSRCCVGGDSDRFVNYVKITGPISQTTNYWQATGTLPFQSAGQYTLYLQVTPSSGPTNNPYDSKTVTLATACANPWFQTQGGDVHTNTRINVP